MPHPHLDELSLAALGGKRREMEQLLRALRPVVTRWAVVLTGSPDVAEDVAQSVLIRVNRSLAQYSPEGKFTAWTYRITRNIVSDVEKKARRDQARLDYLAADQMSGWVSGHQNALELLDAADQLKRFMTGLSPQQRAVLDLVELQGFSHADVAEMLEISAATVRVHLHRAKAAMGEALRLEEDQRRHG